MQRGGGGATVKPRKARVYNDAAASFWGWSEKRGLSLASTPSWSPRAAVLGFLYESRAARCAARMALFGVAWMLSPPLSAGTWGVSKEQEGV